MGIHDCLLGALAYKLGLLVMCQHVDIFAIGDSDINARSSGQTATRGCSYVAAKATYIRLLFWQKGFFFVPSSVKRGRTHIVLG